ncbi:MAG: hypothetical protein R3E66_05445 [bacterium]
MPKKQMCCPPAADPENVDETLADERLAASPRPSDILLALQFFGC